MIHILRGPAGCGKTTCLYGILLKEAKENKDRNYILSVPEQFTLSAMKKIMELSDEKGMLNIDVLSFNRLSHRIFRGSGMEKSELLDDTAKNLIIRQIASEKKDDLKVFGANLNKQGYVSSVKSVISEFMQYGYGLFDIDDMIKKAAATQPYLALKLADIRIIYEEFIKRLGNDYITVEELLVRAAKEAPGAKFLKGAVSCFDGFTGFTPVQYELIKSLYDITGDMYVTVTDDGKGSGIFELGRSTIDKLEKIAGDDIEIIDVNDMEIVRHRDDPVFAFLGKNLFGRKKDRIAGNESIGFIRTENTEEEVRFVLSSIRKMTLFEGYRYRDFAIIMGDNTVYADILKKEAQRRNIPVYVDMTKGIELNPFSRMLKAAVSCVTEDMSYAAVFNFLRTGMTDISFEEIDLAENYVRAYGIRGMKKYSSGFRKSYRGISQEMTEAAEKVRKTVYSLIKPLYEIKNRASITEYTKRLYELTISLSMEEKLKESSREFEKAMDMARKMEFDQVYEQVMGLFDRMAGLLGERITDIEEYSGILDAGLSEIRVGTLPPAGDCIHAGDLLRSRFDEIRVLFVMGLCEGNIPSAPVKGGIISDMDRQLLKDNEFELAPTAIEKTDTEKFYYYMNILKPTDKLFLSYAATGPDGSQKNPSFFMKETLKLFKDQTIESYDSCKEERIYDRVDVLTRLAGQVGDNKESYELYNAVKDSPEAEKILDAGFHKSVDRLSAEAGRVLFEGALLESATELERYAACAYAHYLKYGLRLRERFDFEFEASDRGIMLHEILRRYSEGLKEKKLTFVNVSDDVSAAVLEQAVDESEKENEKLGQLFDSSSRNAYMRQRIGRIAERTVETLRFQARAGKFVPSDFEKKFSCEGIRGIIDRIDKYEDGQDIYIDIIDYKSGNKTFDKDRIYYGLDLQLVIYMSAAMDIEVRLKGRDQSLVHPAGLFYYHIDDPLIDEDDIKDEDEIADRIHEELRLRGLVNSEKKVCDFFDKDLAGSSSSKVIPVRIKNDGGFMGSSSVATEGQIREMIAHTSKLVSDFREEIRAGHIEKEPFVLGSENACTYCDYTDICNRGKRRKLKKDPGHFSSQNV